MKRLYSNGNLLFVSYLIIDLGDFEDLFCLSSISDLNHPSPVFGFQPREIAPGICAFDCNSLCMFFDPVFVHFQRSAPNGKFFIASLEICALT